MMSESLIHLPQRLLRICVFGAGATGGLLAAKLAKAGHHVCVVARGAHLQAIRQRGVILRGANIETNAKVLASDDPVQLGKQDIVFVTVKATAMEQVASTLAPLLSADTVVAFLQNGVPWWYPVGLPSNKPAPPDLPIFRTASQFLATITPEQLAAGTIYSANEVIGPGIIRNNSPEANRIDIGAVAVGNLNPAIPNLRAALTDAGVESQDAGDVRRAVWAKLLVNLSGSILALATEQPAIVARHDPALAEVYDRLVAESCAIAAAHGYDFDGIQGNTLRQRLIDHKPSLLQDYEHHRSVELEAIVLAPLAFARVQGICTPSLDAVAAIVVRRARDRGLI